MYRSIVLLLLLVSFRPAHAQTSTAVTTNNDFAFRFFQQAGRSGPNFCISPYSIVSASAMLYAGSAGPTEKEFQKVFGFGSNDEATHNAFGQLQNELGRRNGKGVQLGIANRLFIEQEYRLDTNYLAGINRHYGAGVQQMDFVNNYEPSRHDINQWVEDKTHARITDLLPPGSIVPLTRLVLVNALYIKGNWNQAFKKADTKPETFFVDAKKQLQVNMMHQDNTFDYTQDANFQLLEMPFKGDSVSMVFVLPRTGLALDDARKLITKEWYDASIAALKQKLVDVSLPKFKTESALTLSKPLKTMGMKDAFTPDMADFSRMDPQNSLYISEGYHKTFVEVEEKGAEAAAATAYVVNTTDSSVYEVPPVFRADRPFFYIIRDKVTGMVLFIGEMKEPNAIK